MNSISTNSLTNRLCLSGAEGDSVLAPQLGGGGGEGGEAGLLTKLQHRKLITVESYQHAFCYVHV